MQTAPKQLLMYIEKKQYYAIIIKLNSTHIKQNLNLHTWGGWFFFKKYNLYNHCFYESG